MKNIFIIFILFLFGQTAFANEVDSLNTKEKRPTYIALGGGFGAVIPTHKFIQNDNYTNYGLISLKYAYTSVGDRWQEIAYGLPYYGIGLSQSFYGRPDELGTPVSLYLFQGATIKNITSRLALNYEFNLGMANNWKPYDPFSNPDNLVIGSIMTVHVAASIYLKWYISQRLDLHIGGTLTHFSNGTSRQPNHGINKGGAYLELVYNFNRDVVKERYNPDVAIPKFTPHFQHDIQFIISSKNVKIDTIGTMLPDIFTDRQFKVYGVNYFLMRASSHKYRYGVGVEYLYDESKGAKVYNRLHPDNGRYYTVTELGSVADRSSMGVSARLEILLPLYAIFIDIGGTVINRDEDLPLLYQALGVKVYLAEDLFGTFGIKAVNFSQAQFLYWSLGYTINSDRKHWRRGKNR